jgi:hypothetical protein
MPGCRRGRKRRGGDRGRQRRPGPKGGNRQGGPPRRWSERGKGRNRNQPED